MNNLTTRPTYANPANVAGQQLAGFGVAVLEQASLAKNLSAWYRTVMSESDLKNVALRASRAEVETDIPVGEESDRAYDRHPCGGGACHRSPGIRGWHPVGEGQ